MSKSSSLSSFIPDKAFCINSGLWVSSSKNCLGVNFTTAEAKYDIKKLLEIMPEKNISWIQGHQTEKQEQASTADELLKFKNLLDQGVITQEEFDKKKTQLLGN